MNTRPEAPGERVPVAALRKGLELLDLIGAAGPAGLPLAALAERMGLKRSTAHNLVKTLCLCGYAENLGEGRYGAGWRSRHLARLVLFGSMGDRVLVERLAGIAASLGEAAVLAVLEGGRRRVVARADGTHAIRVDAEAVDSSSGVIWATVTGRVLAAWCSAAERGQVLALSGSPSGPVWPAGSAGLDAALSAVRSAGYAEDDARGVTSFAVPVLAANGALLAALGTYLPTFRCSAERREVMLEVLRRSAAGVAAVMRASLEADSV